MEVKFKVCFILHIVGNISCNGVLSKFMNDEELNWVKWLGENAPF